MGAATVPIEASVRCVTLTEHRQQKCQSSVIIKCMRTVTHYYVSRSVTDSGFCLRAVSLLHNSGDSQ